jgi:hypothetical protein
VNFPAKLTVLLAVALSTLTIACAQNHPRDDTRKEALVPEQSAVYKRSQDAMKAIEKDRERRYDSPLELAADLRRYLNHEPVIARPPSVLYRTGKFVRRNRLAVGLVSALALLIIGFAITMTIERNRANREAEVAAANPGFTTKGPRPP